jgi:hypothetical protein
MDDVSHSFFLLCTPQVQCNGKGSDKGNSEKGKGKSEMGKGSSGGEGDDEGK